MDPCRCPGRYIPEPVRRQVRQRCGFGCIFCGNPIIEYHHIEEWRAVRHLSEPHDPKKITLLCDGDHRRAGSGLIPKEQVIRQDKSPRNRGTKMTPAETLHYAGGRCGIQLGRGFRVTDSGSRPGRVISALVVNSRQLISFRFEMEHLLLSAHFLDEKNNLFLQILDNELSFTTTGWDATFIGRELEVISAEKETRLKLRFDPPSDLTVLYAKMYCDGLPILISEAGMAWGDNLAHPRMINCLAADCDVAIAFGKAPPGVSVGFGIPLDQA